MLFCHVQNENLTLRHRSPFAPSPIPFPPGPASYLAPPLCCCPWNSPRMFPMSEATVWVWGSDAQLINAQFICGPSSWKADTQPWIHSSVSSAPPLPAEPDHKSLKTCLPFFLLHQSPWDLVTRSPFISSHPFPQSLFTSTAIFYPDHFLPMECNFTSKPISPSHLLPIISLDLVHWPWLGWTNVVSFIWNHGIWSQRTWMLAYLNFYLWFEMQTTMQWRHYFANKDPSSQGYGFSSSHVWMWELDHKESWVQKNWRFWTVVLEKSLESPLDCKEIKSFNPKGNLFWIFFGRTDAEA